MVTPALDSIGAEFNISPGFMQALVMSIFLLGYAQGPFVLAPLSEMFGRVPVLQYANLIYLAFNTACGFAKSRDQLLAFRFLSGIGGSAPQAVSIENVLLTLHYWLTHFEKALQWCTCRLLEQRGTWKGPGYIWHPDVPRSNSRTDCGSVHIHEH